MDNFETIVIEQLSNINSRLNGFDEKFDKIDERFEKIDEKFEKIDQRFNEMEENFDKKLNNCKKDILKEIDNLRGSVVLLENKVLSEFPALYEAFELNRKLQDDRNEKVAYLSEKTEEHSIRIAALEDKIKAV